MGGGGPIGGSGGAAGWGVDRRRPGRERGPHGKWRQRRIDRRVPPIGSHHAAGLASATRSLWKRDPRPAVAGDRARGREHPDLCAAPTFCVDPRHRRDLSLRPLSDGGGDRDAGGARRRGARGVRPGETDAACATRFARNFGRKAFRRALDDDEVTDMMKVFAEVCPGPSASCASPADFATAINLMIKAFILAPSFLYRTELGPRSLTANAAGGYPDTALTADEVATQLGFLLLGSTPDAGLLAAADSGALDDAGGNLSELNRLLALPAAQANVTGMVAQWLGVDHLADKTKDPALLSPLGGPDQDQAAIAADLRTSWDRTVTATLLVEPTRQGDGSADVADVVRERAARDDLWTARRRDAGTRRSTRSPGPPRSSARGS